MGEENNRLDKRAGEEEGDLTRNHFLVRTLDNKRYGFVIYSFTRAPSAPSSSSRGHLENHLWGVEGEDLRGKCKLGSSVLGSNCSLKPHVQMELLGRGEGGEFA